MMTLYAKGAQVIGAAVPRSREGRRRLVQQAERELIHWRGTLVKAVATVETCEAMVAHWERRLTKCQARGV